MRPRDGSSARLDPAARRGGVGERAGRGAAGRLHILSEDRHGLKMGYRGRFGMYIRPLMEEPGLAEVEHNPRNNRMRAI